MSNVIVVGVDERRQSRDAVALATALAAASDAQLVLVHVHPYDPLAYSMALGAPAASALAEEAEQILRAAAKNAPETARTVSLAATSPSRGLQVLAERENARLIVVGSTHRGHVGRIMLGSHAESVITDAPCAVAVAPSGLADRDWSIREIAVGFDGGPESREALAWARTLAHATGAALRLYGVVDATPVAIWAPYTYVPDWKEIADERRTAMERRLAQAAEGATSEVLAGDVVEQLVGVSTRSDLLVLGSRAYGPVRRVLLGATSHRVLRNAACPVIVVPRSASPLEPAPAAEPAEQTRA